MNIITILSKIIYYFYYLQLNNCGKEAHTKAMIYFENFIKEQFDLEFTGDFSVFCEKDKITIYDDLKNFDTTGFVEDNKEIFNCLSKKYMYVYTDLYKLNTEYEECMFQQ